MDNEYELEKYHSLWDGTQEWMLVESVIPSILVTIEFEGEFPNAREIVALRKAVEQFRDRSLKDIKEQLGQSKSIDIGTFTGFELHSLIPDLQQHHLSAKLTNKSYSGYIPYHPASGTMLMGLALENRDLLAKIVQKLLVKGVPILDMPFEID